MNESSLNKSDGSEIHAEITFVNTLRFVFSKKKIIVSITSVFIVLSVTYALLSQPVFRSEVTMIEAQDNNSNLARYAGFGDTSGSLGLLAGFAGFGSMEGSRMLKAIAIAESRTFIEEFISELNLLPILFEEEWNTETKTWKEKSIDLNDGYLSFKAIYSINKDDKIGVFSLAVEWKDPVLASEWANSIVHKINKNLREQEIEQANKNIQYLEIELEKATKINSQNMLYNLIEEQSKIKMLANVQEQFIFLVIDKAIPAKERIRPERRKMVIFGFLIGLIFSISLIYILEYVSLLRRLFSEEH